MSRLSSVYDGLHELRRLRRVVRHGAAWTVVVCAALWMFLAAFGLDYWLRMGVLERLIVLIAFAAATTWLARRYIVAAIRAAESDTELALMVEQQQGMNSDLVAAIQFEDGSRPQYGSMELREAVVDCAAESSRSLRYTEGFSLRPLSRYAMVAGASALVFLATLIAAPRQAGTFAMRLLLLGGKYPTRTIIAEVIRPGARAAYGQSVDFEVRIDGERPSDATVRLQALSTGFRNEVRLLPDAARPGVYRGKLPRLLDSLQYTVHAGDAQTDPCRLGVMPLPIVDVGMEVRAPAYASASRPIRERARHITAPEGAAVTPIITATKPLRRACILMAPVTPADADAAAPPRSPIRFDMTRQGIEMAFVPPAGNPLAVLDAGVRFEITVEDEDGLGAELPIVCSVQVRPDQEPRVGIAAASQYVLPTARPHVRYQAIDDYALDRLIVRRTIVKAADGARSEAPPVTINVTEHRARVAGACPLNLAELALAPGDEVIVMMEAVDFRGSTAGKIGRSDRITFQVTSREGILQTAVELDKRMDEKLDGIIRAQLGIGD